MGSLRCAESSARHSTMPLAEAGLDPWDVATQGLIEAWEPQLVRGVEIIAIRDVPLMRRDIVACVTDHQDDPNGYCSSIVEEALGGRDFLIEAAAVAALPVVDLSDLFCTSSTCVPIIGNVMAYQNKDHLTATFARLLGPVLGDRIAAALRSLDERLPSVNPWVS